jgi:hypothetical protein
MQHHAGDDALGWRDEGSRGLCKPSLAAPPPLRACYSLIGEVRRPSMPLLGTLTHPRPRWRAACASVELRARIARACAAESVLCGSTWCSGRELEPHIARRGAHQDLAVGVLTTPMRCSKGKQRLHHGASLHPSVDMLSLLRLASLHGTAQ